jgi:hypothetical protein
LWNEVLDKGLELLEALLALFNTRRADVSQSFEVDFLLVNI